MGNLKNPFTVDTLNATHLCPPVYRSNDEGDGGEAYSCGGPLADGQGPPGGSAQQVE